MHFPSHYTDANTTTNGIDRLNHINTLALFVEYLYITDDIKHTPSFSCKSYTYIYDSRNHFGLPPKNRLFWPGIRVCPDSDCCHHHFYTSWSRSFDLLLLLFRLYLNLSLCGRHSSTKSQQMGNVLIISLTICFDILMGIR